MFKNISQTNLNVFLLILVAVLILLNGISIFRNNQIIIQNNQLREDLSYIRQTTSSILTRIVQATDVAVRGYALTEQDMFVTAFGFLNTKQDTIFAGLKRALDQQDFALNKVQRLEKETSKYLEFSWQMIEKVQEGDLDAFKNMLGEKRGDQLYEVYVEASDDIFAFINEKNRKATEKYSSALAWNKWLQIALLLISLPTIFSVALRMKKEQKEREKLYEKLAENNDKHLFNPGKKDQVDKKDLEDVLGTSIMNMQKASDFVTNIAEGNYTINWDGLDQSNLEVNQQTLAGALVKMRDKMKAAKEADRQHLWVTDGLSEFSKLVRNYQDNLEKFADESIAFLVKYLKAQQGGLFVIKEDDESEEEEPYLKLEACYAFDKKKYIEKRVELGNGLVGQTYLEKQYSLLTELPEGYTQITSGLGDASPTCLIVMPFIYNEKVEAVIELASFHIFEEHHIDFLQKAGEFVASALINLKTSEKMKSFVEESRDKTEQMRAQEEELRQNMEEMASTQEEMNRREKELIQQMEEKEAEIKRLKGEKE